jgi:basic membrane protein A
MIRPGINFQFFGGDKMKRSTIWMAIMALTLLATIPGHVHAQLGKVCLATTGVLKDHGFNQLAWAGMLDARKAGLVSEIVYREPDPVVNTSAQQNLKAFIKEGNCDLIIAGGFELGNATIKAAKSYPSQKIAVVDFDPSSAGGNLPNLMGLAFQSDQAAFLAGYVGAAVSKTGVLGTFGGKSVTPVVQFMDGFDMGMRYFNKRHSKHISLKGWSPRKPGGLFTGSFESIPAGYRMASRLYQQGADIVFPVAGMSSYGAAYFAMVSPKRSDLVIGVDVDFHEVLKDTPGAKDVLLTSVLKKVDVAVKETISLTRRGKFNGGLYVGTLENGGVGIAPFYELAERVRDVNPRMSMELKQITQGIIDGSISTRRQNPL